MSEKEKKSFFFPQLSFGWQNTNIVHSNFHLLRGEIDRLQLHASPGYNAGAGIWIAVMKRVAFESENTSLAWEEGQNEKKMHFQNYPPCCGHCSGLTLFHG